MPIRVRLVDVAQIFSSSPIVYIGLTPSEETTCHMYRGTNQMGEYTSIVYICSCWCTTCSRICCMYCAFRRLAQELGRR